MLIWSPFILDELAGLRNDALPTCPQCQKDPAFLAKNSGFVTAIKGPNGTEPAQYGEISSWAILDGAAPTRRSHFVEYMMGDGYPGWLGMAPEGKLPGAQGHRRRPEEVPRPPGTTSQAGCGHQEAPRRRLRRRDADQLCAAARTPSSAGASPRARANSSAPMLGELPVPKALGDLVTGKSDAAADRQRRHEGRRGDQDGRQLTTDRTRPPAAPRPAERPARDRRRRPLTLAAANTRAGLALVAPTLLDRGRGDRASRSLWTPGAGLPAGPACSRPRKTGLFGELTLDNFDRVCTAPASGDSLWTTLIYSRAAAPRAPSPLGLVAALAAAPAVPRPQRWSGRRCCCRTWRRWSR